MHTVREARPLYVEFPWEGQRGPVAKSSQADMLTG
jgi:hypothetical protein